MTSRSPIPQTAMDDNRTAQNLPPPRKSKPLRHVSKPLSTTRLSRLVYLLVFLSAVLAAYYSWRVLVWKTDVGGWWNLALGRRAEGYGSAGTRSNRRHGDESVQDKINALALALGVPSKELASAIASAVRSYVPSASLSSVANAEKTPVEALFGGDEEEGGGGHLFARMETLVGMDEPPDVVMQD
jgi:hypothetical protein